MIMRKIIFLVSLFIAPLCAVTTLSAQNTKSITLHHGSIKEIHSTLPTCITVTNDGSDLIEISFPAAVEPYIKIEIDKRGNILDFDRADKRVSRDKLAQLNDKNPIRVRMSSAVLSSILNTSDMSVAFEDGSVGEWFNIVNTGSIFVNGEVLKAKNKIEYYNTGTFTSEIKSYNTDILGLTSTGFLYVNGSTTAKYIDQSSTGIENTNLKVSCVKLTITSTGSGVIKYEGTADQVEVMSTGSATIHTSKLNYEQ